MERSIAAKYAARPAARFVRPSSRVRERRLGLRASVSFQAAPLRVTILRRADLGPLVRLRAGWRAVRPARPSRSTSGQPRPIVTIHWPRSGKPRPDRPASAATAPWQG